MENPFEFEEIKNDKTLETKYIKNNLDEYTNKMRGKKKWCIEYWTSNEGYKRINDYFLRIKTNSNTYKKIPAIYKNLKDKMINDDEKLKEIIECIKKQMKPEKEVIEYLRGDNELPTKYKSFHIETFISVTHDEKTAKSFGNYKNVFKMIVNPDVKRINISINLNDDIYKESEILLEDDCYLDISDRDNKIIKVSSPRSDLKYPYRSNLPITIDKYKDEIYNIEKIIDYYCDRWFIKRIDEYIYHYIFYKKEVKHYVKNFNYFNFMIYLKNDVLLKSNNKVIYKKEYTFDGFNELIKDIYIKNKKYYEKEFINTYLPKIKKLLTK